MQTIQAATLGPPKKDPVKNPLFPHHHIISTNGEYGKTVYLMPPYCLTDEQLVKAYAGMLEGLSQLQRR